MEKLLIFSDHSPGARASANALFEQYRGGKLGDYGSNTAYFQDEHSFTSRGIDIRQAGWFSRLSPDSLPSLDVIMMDTPHDGGAFVHEAQEGVFTFITDQLYLSLDFFDSSHKYMGAMYPVDANGALKKYQGIVKDPVQQAWKMNMGVNKLLPQGFLSFLAPTIYASVRLSHLASEIKKEFVIVEDIVQCR